MKKIILAVLLAVLMMLSSAPTAFAGDDDTPPVLNGVTLNAETFNRGDTLTVTVNAETLGGGFDLTKCYISFCNVEYVPANASTPIYVKLNEACEGGLNGSVSLDKYDYATYAIDSIYLVDSNGNISKYNKAYGDVPDVIFKLKSNYEVPPIYPIGGPVVTDYRISKKTAYVGDTVTLNLTAQYSSGVAYASMQLMPETVPWQDYVPYDIPLFPVEGNPGMFEGTFIITKEMPQSTFSERNIIFISNDGKTSRYMDLCGNETWAGLHKVLKVINPSYKYISPKLTAFSISSHNVTQGEKLTITATMCEGCSEIVELLFPIYNMNTLEYDKSYSIFRQTDGKFKGTITIPFELKNGDYFIGLPLGSTYKRDHRQNSGGVSGESYLKAIVKIGQNSRSYLSGGVFSVVSAVSISGTHNRTILQGEAFDAMQGVTAANYYTGDITDKLTVSGGDFDTNVPGIYLIKYKISDTVTIDGVNNSLTYTDYRWIGVTETPTQAAAKNGEYPLVITDGSLVVGASNSEVSIKKDGGSVPYNSVLTEPGEYTFSNGGDTIARAVGNTVSVMSVGDSGKSITAVIDWSAPEASASWRKDTATGLIYVALKARDMSGVAEIKYMQGEHTLETCKDGGTVYGEKFTLPAYGKVTVYTRDGLGNEGIRVINISKTYSDSAYLWDVNVSAGVISPEFLKTKYSYKINLAEDEGSITLTPVKECDAAVMKINGKVQDSITVDVGNNQTKTVTVKVSYGGKTKTYTFTIKKAKSTNNDLTSLTATVNGSNIPFNEAFSPDNLSYSLNLDEFTKSVKITDTAAPYATASFKSKTFTLNNGETKTIVLSVTAQSGAKKNYTVTVTRDKSTDNTLKSLKTSSRSFVLSPAFTPEVTAYTIAMPASKDRFTLYASSAGYGSSVTIDGKKRTSKGITLARGQSVTVSIVVTAQSGDTKEYIITVERA